MRSGVALLATALALGAGSLVARAEPAAPAPREPLAIDWWAIPDADRAVARLVMEANLRRGHALAPLTLAPDLAVGIDDGLGLLVHTSRAAEGALGAGNGVCLMPTNETLGRASESCPRVDHGLGVSALVRLARRADTIARVGLVARDWAPLAIALEVGTSSTVRAGRLWAQAAPTLVVGLSAREDGNRDRVQVPIYLGVSPLARAELHVRTGLDGTIATFRDTYAIPLGAGASVQLARVRVGADVSLDKALGPLNATSWRSASVYVQGDLGW